MTPNYSAGPEDDMLWPVYDPIYNDDDYKNWPKTPEEWEERARKREEELGKLKCETRTPWSGPPVDPDPEKPPKGPWWKKVGYVIAKLLELFDNMQQ